MVENFSQDEEEDGLMFGTMVHIASSRWFADPVSTWRVSLVHVVHQGV